jgi:hypothetical protein
MRKEGEDGNGENEKVEEKPEKNRLTGSSGDRAIGEIAGIARDRRHRAWWVRASEQGGSTDVGHLLRARSPDHPIFPW